MCGTIVHCSNHWFSFMTDPIITLLTTLMYIALGVAIVWVLINFLVPAYRFLFASSFLFLMCAAPADGFVVISSDQMAPIVSGVERIGIDLHDKTTIKWMTDFVARYDSHKDFFSKEVTIGYDRKSCDDWIFKLDIASDHNCIPLSPNPGFTICGETDHGNLFNVDDFSVPSGIVKMSKLMTPIIGAEGSYYYFKNRDPYDERNWICLSQQFVLMIGEEQKSYTTGELMWVSLFNSIEFKDTLSDCTSYKCVTGVKKTFEDFLSSFDKNPRVKRSEPEEVCEPSGFWQYLTHSVQCDVSVQTSMKRDLDGVISVATKENDEIKRLNHVSSSIAEEFRSKMSIINKTSIELEGKITETNHLATQRIRILQFMQTAIRTDTLNRVSILSKMNSVKFESSHLIDYMVEYAQLTDNVKLCIEQMKCEKVDNFIFKSSPILRELSNYNFNLNTSLTKKGDSIFLTFNYPSTVEKKKVPVYSMPEVTIKKDCREIDVDVFMCRKCYHQNGRFITLHTGEGTHLPKISGEVILKSIVFSGPCLSEKNITTSHLKLPSGMCLDLGGEFDTFTKCDSNVSTFSSVNLKMLSDNKIGLEKVEVDDLSLFPSEMKHFQKIEFTKNLDKLIEADTKKLTEPHSIPSMIVISITVVISFLVFSVFIYFTLPSVGDEIWIWLDRMRRNMTKRWRSFRKRSSDAEKASATELSTLKQNRVGENEKNSLSNNPSETEELVRSGFEKGIVMTSAPMLDRGEPSSRTMYKAIFHYEEPQNGLEYRAAIERPTLKHFAKSNKILVVTPQTETGLISTYYNVSDFHMFEPEAMGGKEITGTY